MSNDDETLTEILARHGAEMDITVPFVDVETLIGDALFPEVGQRDGLTLREVVARMDERHVLPEVIDATIERYLRDVRTDIVGPVKAQVKAFERGLERIYDGFAIEDLSVKFSLTVPGSENWHTRVDALTRDKVGLREGGKTLESNDEIREHFDTFIERSNYKSVVNYEISFENGTLKINVYCYIREAYDRESLDNFMHLGIKDNRSSVFEITVGPKDEPESASRRGLFKWMQKEQPELPPRFSYASGTKKFERAEDFIGKYASYAIEQSYYAQTYRFAFENLFSAIRNYTREAAQKVTKLKIE